MFKFLSSLIRLLPSPGNVKELALENLALRQQLTVLKRRYPRLRLRRADRLFWVWLSTVWSRWRQALMIVRPETVVSWPKGVPPLLDLDFQAQASWSTRGEHRDQGLNSPDGASQPFLGSTPDSRRIAEIGARGLGAHRVAVSAQEPKAPFPDLEGFP
jgi:hypothetical protein